MHFMFFLVGYSLFRYKFDDERVTKEDMKKALEEQYGGEEEVTHSL
jgi:ubiquitin carboxyl-terminal hydrolase 7